MDVDGMSAQPAEELLAARRSAGGTRLDSVLDAAFDGITLLRAVRDEHAGVIDFRCEFVNQVGAKLLGRALEDVVGRALSDISPTTWASGLFDRYREALATGEPWRQELAVPELEQIWEIKAARVDSEFVAVSFRDITELVGQQEQFSRSVARARRAAERTNSLQVATAALVAASTSDQVYEAIGTVVRPSAGGHGLVVLLREEDSLVLRYHAGYEPDVVAQLATLPVTHQYPATSVARTGLPRYLHRLEQFTAAQPDPATAVSAGGRQAWAMLPLTTAGTVLGTLVIGYAEPREFDEEERATLMTLAGLSAQALQRTLLYEAQLSIAAALQRALLPAVLPELAGMRHAVQYLPWTHGADVGGDWYDLFPVGADAVAVVIGDVVGHNASAAATMGQVRNALRAYALDGYPPTGVMDRVNALMLRLGPETIATCCYLELHLAEGTATAVLAGHPPPIMRGGDATGPLSARLGPPLGVQPSVAYLDTTFLLPPGSNLLLYTDGLVEDRRYDISRGLAELTLAVRTAPTRDPADLVAHVLSAAVGPDPRTDDVAILALAVDAEPAAGPRTASRTFRSDATSASAARRFAADILTAWGQRPLVDDASLLLGELVTNAVQHTVGDFTVRLALGDRLRVEVHDASNRLPGVRTAATYSEDGRGLHIVAGLADRWDHVLLPGGGKVVWFELPVVG